MCTLTDGDYEEKNGDYWLKVYQVKMKTYKRIPIPEALYKLVQVYKKKYQIGPEEYLFKSKKGGAFQYATLRYQMLKYCEKNKIADGDIFSDPMITDITWLRFIMITVFPSRQYGITWGMNTKK